MFHERKPAAMTDEDLINVQHDIGRHEDDLDRQLKQIQALEKQVSDLKTIVRNLFVLCSSIQRFSDRQENAFKSLEEQLKQ